MPENSSHFLDTNIWLYALIDSGEDEKSKAAQILIKSSKAIVSTQEEYSLSFWDSLIVSAAFLSGAEIIYSEDMQAGLVISESLKVVNPLK